MVQRARRVNSVGLQQRQLDSPSTRNGQSCERHLARPSPLLFAFSPVLAGLVSCRAQIRRAPFRTTEFNCGIVCENADRCERH